VDFFERRDITYGALRGRQRLRTASRASVRKGGVGVMLPNVAAMPTTWLALAAWERSWSR
jgi:hypothetical protein